MNDMLQRARARELDAQPATPRRTRQSMAQEAHELVGTALAIIYDNGQRPTDAMPLLERARELLSIIHTDHEITVKALREIADADYRGNRNPEQGVAYAALRRTGDTE